MKTNDLKKGDRVRLRNGWFATVEDNRRGVRRMLTVEGFYTEMGDVYSHDIEYYILPEGTDPVPGVEYALLMGEGFGLPLEHTDAQLKLKAQVETF